MVLLINYILDHEEINKKIPFLQSESINLNYKNEIAEIYNLVIEEVKKNNKNNNIGENVCWGML